MTGTRAYCAQVRSHPVNSAWEKLNSAIAMNSGARPSNKNSAILPPARTKIAIATKKIVAIIKTIARSDKPMAAPHPP